MIYIAHRAQISGLSSEANHPGWIDKVLSANIHCEVDCWYSDKHLYLGHDKPTYRVNIKWLLERAPMLWVHAKSLETLEFLYQYHNDINYFWHENDEFTLTSWAFIWTRSNGLFGPKSVVVMDGPSNERLNCYGVCTDWVPNVII